MDQDESEIMDRAANLKLAPAPGEKVQLGVIDAEVQRYIRNGEWVVIRAPEDQVPAGKIRVGQEDAPEEEKEAKEEEAKEEEAAVQVVVGKRVSRSFENGCLGVLKTGVSVF